MIDFTRYSNIDQLPKYIKKYDQKILVLAQRGTLGYRCAYIMEQLFDEMVMGRFGGYRDIRIYTYDNGQNPKRILDFLEKLGYEMTDEEEGYTIGTYVFVNKEQRVNMFKDVYKNIMDITYKLNRE